MDSFTSSKTITYSVSQLNRNVKSLLEQNFFSIQVIGEISNLSRPASGHLYFSLKDDRAQVRCALFRSQAQKLKFVPENGLQIQASANVSLYEARGDYQLIVNQMQEIGDGALRRAFEQLKAKLDAKGLFSPEHKKQLPLIPRSIGIITSASGAAIRDILSVLARRFPSIPVIIYPVMVQGDEAKYEINQAIITANQRKECDVLILARGGGSLEDLWAFNEEMVANAIYKSRIPIISGIGHETDTTIADYVADLRAATPTAAAEHSTPDGNQWLGQFQAYEQRLNQLIRNKIQQTTQHLDWLAKNLHQQHPGKQLQIKSLRLDELELRLSNNIQNRLNQAYAKLTAQHAQLWQFNPAHTVQRLKSEFKSLNERLDTNIKTKLHESQQKLSYLSQTLNIVSPLATLHRGYTFTTDEQHRLITTTQHLSVGQNIKTRLATGTITSQIQEIDHE
ncbi:exodeoxyribonuclease VII large subunit [Bathymodiolus platifrons methanotrophic gill symbiont]|uniref:exodeoxyribonuclease VII large subunit n=1 Tax=Bathymodiolus platifrons methanotrophic gill symbiont TaxID=113268 RepID=UPI000B4108AA|nr:exodeoxyribonuclease VII large subunit [Bathymodiolus platifrons methanotrophic gill symbiont]MCK5870560.1 exodeoxyribonuclease VII large subunit [Methyloprofundus sp.]TXK94371.1 exodeoxyribonuclease VII large subunit [Methylococcaceae bacterium CS4]TXK97215.1 exodeoxyribonuclease VII large subunit [Methylococcaceae bacterium CS5]TXL03453.1 exodeoxyribonuclease VII large subunit [Methylococcaceae bacterium CS1]TXL03537.1 exodeoxyribonuclease VII large subunit [Methylococcaceae bacterium CS3